MKLIGARLQREQFDAAVGAGVIRAKTAGLDIDLLHRFHARSVLPLVALDRSSEGGAIDLHIFREVLSTVNSCCIRVAFHAWNHCKRKVLNVSTASYVE